MGAGMDMRELVGYAMVVLAVAIVVGGLLAARYHSPGRRYARLRAKEREREKLRRASIDTQSTSS